MAKAADENTISWILLRDARCLVTQTYQASGLAERFLIHWIAAGEVRWRCLGMEGRKQESDPGLGDREFWRETASSGPGVHVIVLRVNWPESSARRNGMGGYTAYRIELALEDIAKLLPGITESVTIEKGGGHVPSKIWIADEVERMKASGQIPEGIEKAAFAKDLAARMRKSAKRDPSIRPIQWKSIANQLIDWGLWPIDSA
jgi:hypothetical protein